MHTYTYMHKYTYIHTHTQKIYIQIYICSFCTKYYIQQFNTFPCVIPLLISERICFVFFVCMDYLRCYWHLVNISSQQHLYKYISWEKWWRVWYLFIIYIYIYIVGILPASGDDGVASSLMKVHLSALFLNDNLCCIFCRWMMMLPAEAAVTFPSSWLSLWQGYYSWFPRLSVQSDLLHGCSTCRCWCRTTSCPVVDVQFVTWPEYSTLIR